MICLKINPFCFKTYAVMFLIYFAVNPISVVRIASIYFKNCSMIAISDGYNLFLN